MIMSLYKVRSVNFFLLPSVVTTFHLRGVILLLKIAKCYTEPRVVEKVDQEREHTFRC